MVLPISLFLMACSRLSEPMTTAQEPASPQPSDSDTPTVEQTTAGTPTTEEEPFKFPEKILLLHNKYKYKTSRNPVKWDDVLFSQSENEVVIVDGSYRWLEFALVTTPEDSNSCGMQGAAYIGPSLINYFYKPGGPLTAMGTGTPIYPNSGPKAGQQAYCVSDASVFAYPEDYRLQIVE